MGKNSNGESFCFRTNVPSVRSAALLFLVFLAGLYFHETQVSMDVEKIQFPDHDISANSQLLDGERVTAEDVPPVSEEKSNAAAERTKPEDVQIVEDAETEDDFGDTEESNCLEYISYNKPVKTGSTSVFFAIRGYLHTKRQNDLGCGSAECAPYAYDVCAGTKPMKHSLGHLHVNLSTLGCLREKNYYMVTSIREPYSRWKSVYLFNRQLQGDHYGIPWNISFPEFVKVFNPCALFKYYERGTQPCKIEDTDEEIDKRVQVIVDMFDDVIELGAEPISDLHHRIGPFIGNQYVSDRSKGEPEDVEIDPQRMRHERKLYEALKKKKSIPPAPGRSLCHKFPDNPKFWPQKLGGGE